MRFTVSVVLLIFGAENDVPKPAEGFTYPSEVEVIEELVYFDSLYLPLPADTDLTAFLKVLLP